MPAADCPYVAVAEAQLQLLTAFCALRLVCCADRLYQKLDWLMLLAEGHLMYYGKADQVGRDAPRVTCAPVVTPAFHGTICQAALKLSSIKAQAVSSKVAGL
jgi:hypothetical protein